MTEHAMDQEEHSHVFLGADHEANARRTWIVIGLTTVMMVLEIAAGHWFGSMALVADGWHMSTHAAALMIAALAYRFARRHAADRRFTFGTGKVGELAGFASSIVLALVALLIGWESALRLQEPVAIDFRQAIAVAGLGLAVNLVCAWILGGHAHHHDHDHDPRPHRHDHGHPHGHAGNLHTDSNLRGAYLHVLADALTSVLAIAALTAGSFMGWVWLDPAVGLIGAAVIAHWAFGLARIAGGVLLDFDAGGDLRTPVARIARDAGARLVDLHVWQLGPGHRGLIVALRGGVADAGAIRRELADLPRVSHVTVEMIG